ncbi:MAG: NAD(P)-binding protein [Candidatus Lokiarchaeota archaeon]|nr:NAD(P)-binding protein [Candidatus Lokiarchaeota archaeon]
MKKVIIIGSGIGGSGIGAMLAKNTQSKVVVFEKNEIIGGRCGSYIKKDELGREWNCDVGTHIFGNSDKGFLGDILRECDASEKVKWAYVRNPGPRINIMGQELSFSLKKKGKSKKRKRRKKKRKSKKKSFKDLITEMSYEDTYQYDDVPLYKWLSDNKQDTFMYGLQAGLMFGTPPTTTSAGEFLRCSKKNAENRAFGYCYGGTGAIPKAYCSIIEENAGTIHIKSKVNRIVIEDNKVKGVEVGKDNTFHPADLVISNADIKTTANELVGSKYLDKEYINYVNGLSWGGQVCSLKLGIDIEITHHKWLNYVPKMDPNMMKAVSGGGSLDDISPTDVPEKSVLMIVPISNLDPALAPDGCQNLHCVTPTLGGRDLPMEERKKISKKWEQCCLNTLLDLWPEIDGHIMYQDFVSDVFLEKKFGKEGAGTGIGQEIGQVGKNRPKQKMPVDNLYLSSGDAGGWGVGTELAAKSALDLYDILIKEKKIDLK